MKFKAKKSDKKTHKKYRIQLPIAAEHKAVGMRKNGASLGEIVNTLDKLGLRTFKGKRVSNQLLSLALIGCGLRVHYSKKAKIVKTKKPVVVPKKQKEVVVNVNSKFVFDLYEHMRGFSLEQLAAARSCVSHLENEKKKIHQ